MFGIMAANLVALCVWYDDPVFFFNDVTSINFSHCNFFCRFRRQYYAVNGWIARRIIAMKKMKSLEKSSNQLMEQSCQDSNQDVCA
jgi:hypothetical protein